MILKNSNCLKKSSKQQHQYQCLQVYQVVNMMQQNLLIFLTFSTVFSLPIEDNVETLEAKAAKKAAKKINSMVLEVNDSGDRGNYIAKA